jgi:hypothetical protein
LNSDLGAITEFQRLKDELTKQLRPIYAELVEGVVRAGSLEVQRSASGEYQFSTEPSFEDSSDRSKQQVPALLSNVPIQLGLPMQSNGQRLIGGRGFRLPSSEEIENLLAHQLPRIAWFNKAYALLDNLPNVIRIEHLRQDPNQLTSALVQYLGESQVERLLMGQNPREGRALLKELQEKINTLMGEVNRGRAAGTELLIVRSFSGGI